MVNCAKIKVIDPDCPDCERWKRHKKIKELKRRKTNIWSWIFLSMYVLSCVLSNHWSYRWESSGQTKPAPARRTDSPQQAPRYLFSPSWGHWPRLSLFHHSPLWSCPYPFPLRCLPASFIWSWKTAHALCLSATLAAQSVTTCFKKWATDKILIHHKHVNL